MSGKCVDHVSICAHSSQMKDLLEFYEKALKPLGIVKMADYRKEHHRSSGTSLHANRRAQIQQQLGTRFG